MTTKALVRFFPFNLSIRPFRYGRTWRTRVVPLAALFLLLTSRATFAACTAALPAGTVNFVQPAALTIARDTPVGTVIYTSSNLATQPNAGSVCTGTTYDLSGYLAAGLQAVSGLSNVYATNVPGIGFRVIDTTATGPTALTSGQWKQVFSYPPYFGLGNNPNSSNGYRIEFIATGPISAGSLSLSRTLAGAYWSESSTALVNATLFATLTTSGSTNIVSQGCTVANSNITVRLPHPTSSSLNSVGATAGTTPFNIALTCNSGINVAYQLDGTPPAGLATNTGVLANLTGAGYATGVGVQVLQGQAGTTTPVTFGALSATYVTTTSANQTVSIPFIARYYKTSATLTPGTVSANATLTMNYQ